MAKWLIWIGGRRFFLVLGCGAICSFLVYNEKISDAIFRDIIIATVAAYIAGNSYQKVRERSADVKEKAIDAISDNQV